VPHFLLRDLIGWLSALAVLAVLAAFFPAELGQKADPFAPAPAGIKPEWYFMFMFQTLKYLPSHILGLEGDIVGILGFGTLGQDAGRKLKTLGFPVAGWSRSAKEVAGFVTYAGADGLDALLARSEILVCLLPLTAATEGILNARLFARLPRGAGLVNAGRGGHLVETDLIAALDSGQLSGAVLDVFREEPLPKGHPFWNSRRRGSSQPTAKVPTTPTVSTSKKRPLSNCWTTASMRPKDSASTGSNAWPSSLSARPRGRRRNSAAPNLASRPRTC